MRVAIAGAGGHAKVVADALLASGEDDLVGFLDDDENLWGSQVFGYPVSGPITWPAPSIDQIALAIGDNRTRKRLFDQLLAADANLATIVHPRATIGAGVRIGRGTVVFAGAIINPDSVVGDNVILNTACSIDHDNAIGSHVHVAPGVHTGAGVRIAQGAFTGIGASILPRVTIGAWAVVAAGAVVIRDVPEHTTVAGVPAEMVKPHAE